MAKIVKNISDQELAIPNVGVVKAGAEVEVSDDFHNANFSEVSKVKESTKADTSSDAAPEASASSAAPSKKK